MRASTPPRNDERDEQREILWRLVKADVPSMTAEIIALIDAVELEVFVGDERRRALRFLRDTAARGYANRLRHKLIGRGFTER
jgi:hypothetical protein